MKLKKIIISCVILLIAVSKISAVNPVITLGGTTNYNFLYGGAGIVFTIANSSANVNTINVQYGLSSSYGSSSTNISYTGPGSIVLTNEITGLQLNTIYHYQIVATDASGTTNSPDATFTNNAVGLVSYLALINYVRTALGTNFNTNTFPYSISNLNNLTTTNWSLVTPTITGAGLNNTVSFNGDTTTGNQLDSVVGNYINTNFLVVAGNITNTLYTIPSGVHNGLFRITSYVICTASGAGTLTNEVVWSDELGLKTNIISSTPLSSTTTSISMSNESVVVHGTNISAINFVLIPASLSGSPAVNIWAICERLQ